MEDDYGLKSIASFLNHQIFVEKNLNPIVNVFGYETRIIKLLIADLTMFIDNNDSLFRKKYQDLGFNLIESIFNIINKTETKSDVIYSAYLFLSKICSENEIEKGFNSVLKKYEDYLKKCVDDFKDPKTIERKSSEIKYVLELYIDLSYENMQIKDSKTAIAIFEKVISAIEATISASKGEEKEIKKSKKAKKHLKERLGIFGKIDDINYEPKKTKNHDVIVRKYVKHENEASPNNNSKPTILISFDSDNKSKCDELKQRLEDKFNAWSKEITNSKIGILIKEIIFDL